MTRVYRILRRPYSKKPLDGEGAYRFGARCSSAGVRLAYTSEHLSLAIIEYFVHIDADDSPKDWWLPRRFRTVSRGLRFLLSNYPQTGIELQRRRNSQRSATGLSAIGAQRFSSCFGLSLRLNRTGSSILSTRISRGSECVRQKRSGTICGSSPKNLTRLLVEVSQFSDSRPALSSIHPVPQD